MIIATAGHVDHGKTSLVRNLTGIETDRLAEEQRRGLSINLGYAYWKISDELTLGFIDVPGHRRFINTMISGVSGIDLGMLVVAADDGVMPQTREHVQVMNLLGVKSFLLVISKCDRVDESRIAEISRDALDLLPIDTSIFEVSNTTGKGIEKLKNELKSRGQRWSARAANGHFRMSIDRAFHLQGQGLVLTGSAASGCTNTGNTLLLQPQNKTVRVRTIRTQDTDAQRATAGERCALNVSGSSSQSVHKDDIERGDWLVADASVPVTDRFDARISLLSEAPFALKRVSNVKLHVGAKRLSARLIVLSIDRSKLRAGETAFAQLTTERPIVCCHGDRFLLRDDGETATLGGGVVLEPHGIKYRKSTESRLSFLAAMEHTNHVEAIQQALKPDKSFLDYTAFLRARNIKNDSDEQPGKSLANVARITIDSTELWLSQEYWHEIKQQIAITLKQLHKKFPNEPGVKPALLNKQALAAAEKRFFQVATVELLQAGQLVMNDGLLSVRGHTATKAAQASPEWQKISVVLKQHGQKIPSVSQLQEQCDLPAKSMQAALQLATRNKQLIKLNAKRYSLPAIAAQFARGIIKLDKDGMQLTVIHFRDHMGCGRNLAVEILEYFDSIRFTQRRGESRIILDKSIPATLFGSESGPE